MASPINMLPTPAAMGVGDSTTFNGNAFYNHINSFTNAPPPTDLAGKVIRLEEEIEQIRADWRRATADLNRMKEQRIGGVDDAYLIKLVEELRYDVSNWCIQHFDQSAGVFAFIRRSLDTRKEFASLVQDPNAYLKSSKWRPKIMQSLIWNQLCICVFGGDGSRMWAGAVDEAMRTLVNRLAPEPATSLRAKGNDGDAPLSKETSTLHKEYHRWRALTSTLLQPCVPIGEVETKSQMLIRYLLELVRPYATLQGPEFFKGLSTIVTNAIVLDREFHQQRAVFQLEMPARNARLYGYGVSREPIGVAWEGNEQTHGFTNEVQLALGAMLKKTGTGDGDDYQKLTVLLKAPVSRINPDKEKLSIEKEERNAKLEAKKNAAVAKANAKANGVGRKPSTSNPKPTSPTMTGKELAVSQQRIGK